MKIHLLLVPKEPLLHPESEHVLVTNKIVTLFQLAVLDMSNQHEVLMLLLEKIHPVIFYWRVCQPKIQQPLIIIGVHLQKQQWNIQKST